MALNDIKANETVLLYFRFQKGGMYSYSKLAKIEAQYFLNSE